MGKFKWAYLGAGNIAKTTAKELCNGDTNEIIAVWNRTFEKAEAFAEQFGGKAYATPEEAILAPGVEGVYIAVNADQHAGMMKRCIQCGKPVLCEKPFTINQREAEEIFHLAREKNVYVAEAMWTWHNATAIKVREWVQSGRLGEIREVKASYAWPILRYAKIPRLVTNEMIGGALMDIGVYAVAYAYRLFGVPEAVECNGRIENGVDLGEQIRLIYTGFSVDVDIAMDQEGGEFFHIYGAGGCIKVPQFHTANRAEWHGKNDEVFEHQANLYDVQFSNVAREIRAGCTESTMVPAEHTIAVMGLLDVCRKQIGVIYPSER